MRTIGNELTKKVPTIFNACGMIHSESGIVTLTRKHVACKRNEFMNISLLLIEISQNEKGLYKLTFIINKYNIYVCEHVCVCVCTWICVHTFKIFVVS